MREFNSLVNLSEDHTFEKYYEEDDNLDIEEDFNQESDEELLDIPTFLRRQAN